MSGFNFSVTRVEAGPCDVPGCAFAARNEVRMFFPRDAGPYLVCGHHKHWANPAPRWQQQRRARGSDDGRLQVSEYGALHVLPRGHAGHGEPQ